jgi:hypothetical protein
MTSSTTAPGAEPLRIANCSGFYGDRVAAAREMVDGGPIDVLTGDWLAELTMLILGKAQAKGAPGYARTFVTQMQDVLGDCLDRGIKVVSNAGGLDPAGCAAAIEKLAADLGRDCTVAYVEGDNLVPRLDELRAAGVELVNMDTGETLRDLGVEPLTANAYLGCWGIAEALRRGADIVVTGRVTDAAVIMGPAAAHFGWQHDDWDELAGALVAGHIIECGTQTTGGNYAFFREVPGLEHPGFPIAEMHADGSCVITKHPDTGGLVSVGTVTAQLLYEIGGIRYGNPDVVARFDSIRLADDGPDRVRVSGTRGEPAPPEVKVAVNTLGGHRNTMTFVLTGLDIEAKADLAERTLWAAIPGGRQSFDEVDVQLLRWDREDPATNADALAHLRVTVKDADEAKVGRAFSNSVIEMVLASYPGFFTTSPPSPASAYGVYYPCLVPADVPHHEVVIAGERLTIPPVVGDPANPPLDLGEPAARDTSAIGGPTTHAPLGRVVGARSGDKGGNANVGLWARSDAGYGWLERFLTVDRLRQLLPETDDLEIERHELPNLRALNFVIRGWLGRGVAASTRLDPQAKGLGEYVRAKWVDVPDVLLDTDGGGT